MLRTTVFALATSILWSASGQASGTTGRITGTLSYPSDHIPREIRICAESVTDGRTTCTDDHVKGAGGTGDTTYAIEVPPGTYRVYSILPDSPYRAYYSEFVVCGSQASCPSHDPISVDVRAGTVVERIDPNDWYAPN